MKETRAIPEINGAIAPLESFGLEVLAFAPHPDDAEMCCGGFLIKMAQKGYRVGIVDLTRGELGSNGTVETRAQEAAQAAEIMGLAVRENLGLPDGWVNPYSGFEDEGPERLTTSHVVRVVEVLRRLRPEIVLVPWHQARHPDHQATSELLTRALFFCNIHKFETSPPTARFLPRQVLYYQMRYRFKPSFLVDISDVYERKRAAIQCYASQFQRNAQAVPTLINAPIALKSGEVRDIYYGAMLGVPHAEPYLSHSSLGLDDPVAHFRHNAFPQAQLFEEPG